jgi:segregation and condensation protein B
MGKPAAVWEEEADTKSLTPEDMQRHLRMLEALLFAATEPMPRAEIALRMPEGVDLDVLLADLQAVYAERGVNLRRFDDRWAFRTAEDLAFVLKREVVEQKKLSRAAVETLAVIAYHQPATRAEIEEVRGVAVSPGTLDVLLEAGWVRLRGRRRSPGRPVTFGTTPKFLEHFAHAGIDRRPAGTFRTCAPPTTVETLANPAEDTPEPNDSPELRDDEIRWRRIYAILAGARPGGRGGGQARRAGRRGGVRQELEVWSLSPSGGRLFEISGEAQPFAARCEPHLHQDLLRLRLHTGHD